jgi:hypothetical protein
LAGRRWGFVPVLGTAGGVLAAAVIAVALLTGGGGATNGGIATSDSAGPAQAEKTPSAAGAAGLTYGPGRTYAAGATGAVSATGATGATGAGGGGRKAPVAPVSAPAVRGPAYASPVPEKLARPKTKVVAASSKVSSVLGTAQTSQPSRGAATFSPAPLPNGRKIVQSSNLELGTPANRIDDVAQEVFEVVRAYNVIVSSSNVSSTGGPGASAQFQLRVPSASLSQALDALSRLRYANVISRTDNTEDVNSPYLSAERESTDVKAALLKLHQELRAATVETRITSLRAQIAKENAALSGAQSSLSSLNRRVDYSNVSVSVVAGTGGASSGGGGFGLHKAGHDALRVLEVTAGVALIGLAAIVPLALLVALAWWLALTVQRRRRERALDLA